MRYRQVRSNGNESIVVGAVLFMIFLLQAPLFFSASNAAPKILSATTKHSNQITITGQNFSPSGAAPQVTFNSSNLAPLISFTNVQVVATLPAGIGAGTYLPGVTNLAMPNQPGVFDVTHRCCRANGAARTAGGYWTNRSNWTARSNWTDGSDRANGSNWPQGPPGLNPLRVAMLRWYEANTTARFSAGINPLDVAFDGANMWVVNNGSNTVTKLRANDGANLGDFAVALAHGEWRSMELTSGYRIHSATA